MRMLFGPIASQLAAKRILIVADGALQFVPFAALTEPGKQGDNPLMLSHEIVNLPSVSSIAVFRQEMSGRKPAPEILAVLADPVFDEDDERVRKNINGRAKARAEASPDARGLLIAAQKAASETGAVTNNLKLPRLPGTREEAKHIAAFIPAAKRKQWLDFKATRAAVTSDELGRYRLIHFATHGFLNSLHPELSGIALSMIDEEGAPRNGFLMAHEVYNLKLAADLVALSACQTGLGKQVRGEGVLGLTRGFMYAGAPRVLMSLWRVSDKATAKLMSYFYESMLKDGLRPAAALRAAQIKMWKHRQWQAPYYWAAFTLQGEWM